MDKTMTNTRAHRHVIYTPPRTRNRMRKNPDRDLDPDPDPEPCGHLAEDGGLLVGRRCDACIHAGSPRAVGKSHPRQPEYFERDAPGREWTNKADTVALIGELPLRT